MIKASKPDVQSTLDRVRAFFSTHVGVSETKSIGASHTFMLNGNMCCSVGAKGLMVRVGPERYPWALSQPHVQPLAFGGKAPVGYVRLDPSTYAGDRQLHRWLGYAVDFVLTLPPKPAKPPRTLPRSARQLSNPST